MTADIEKAREALTEIAERAECMMSGEVSYLQHIAKLSQLALRALDGDGGERWTAVEISNGVWGVQRDGGVYVVGGLAEATAKRIADDHNKRDALERAARDVLSKYPGPREYVVCVSPDAINALRTALNERPK